MLATFLFSNSSLLPQILATVAVRIGTRITVTTTAAAHCTVADSTYGAKIGDTSAMIFGVATQLPAAVAIAAPA